MSMKIAVALGGEYADFLIGLLMEKKYKVTVIDPDKAFCEHLCASYNVNAVLGDPCRQFILEEAGIRNYDVILALGREDTDNFDGQEGPGNQTVRLPGAQPQERGSV